MRFTCSLPAMVTLAAASLAGTLAGCASVTPAAFEPVPSRVEAFKSRVNTLASDDFGGRAPGTPGIEKAARFIERELARAGVAAFGRGAEPWRFPFEVAGELEVNAASFAYEAPGVSGMLKLDQQFAPLGISGEGSASGPLVFVGYGIEDGPDGYTSFAADEDLTGKVALLFRFEPMDENGQSLWKQNDERWTNAAGLRAKFDNVLRRNPAGIVFVSPPGADDNRAAALPSARSTRFGSRTEVPIVAATTEAVDRLVQLADHEGRSLLELRKLADAGTVTSLDLSGGRVALEVSMTINQVETSNVAGVIPGRGALVDEWVVVGAHYDHLGFGEVGTSRSPADVGKTIHAGADDNASGVAGVLHVAETLASRYAALEEGAAARSVLLLFFSAEESGLLGSKAFMDDAPIDPGSITAMVNLDMIGRLRRDALTINGVGTAEQFDDLLPAYWATHGFRAETSRGGLGPSDHASFYRGRVPVLAFFTGLHDDYHTSRDTPEKVNAVGGARIAALVADLAYDLAVRPDKLVYVDIQPERRAGPMRRSSVRLGFMPGTYDETERGALVGEVLPASPAERAGLRQGDRIVAWDGEEIANIFGYMQALGGHKPGDVVRLSVERDGSTIDLEATLEASDQTR